MSFNAVAAIANAALEDEVLAPLFARAMQASAAARVYLVELFPYLAGNNGADWTAPVAAWANASLPDGEEGQTGITQLSFSDRGYTTKPSDALANIFYDGRADVPLVVERSIPISPDTERRASVQFGAVELINSDGYLDTMLQLYAIDGRRVRVLGGLASYAYADFGTIFDGVATGWEADLERVRISLRDSSYRLDLPLQQSLYAGTGGLEGTSDVQGKPKPLCFGKCLNITPILIDPANWVYQFHSRQAQAVLAVYSRGAAVTASGADYPTYAALASATITAGQYATCLAQGLIRINFNTGAGVVTADVQGDAVGGYVSSAAKIAKRMLNDFGGFADTNLRTVSFDQLHNLQGAVIGWYSGSEAITTAEAVSQILASVSGYWLAERDGRIAVGRLDAPDASNPSLELDATDMIEVTRLPLPDALYPPNYRRRTVYQRNWTLQRGEDLAGSVTADRRNFLTQGTRLSTAIDASVQTKYLQTTDPEPLPSFFDSAVDAASEAARLLTLYKVERQLLSVRVKTLGHVLDLGANVIASWPRFGIARKAFRVTGIREECDKGDIILTLWG